ncbi:hypothetical protein ALI144C_44800 [Actinosynnema sp. ALI-1.44]|uniref:hypothetical protein n=1 Tax=Actinosynnema sp. ALI-1.44 TaxID=1933779 RepID=UPI00097C5F05|nr:hypothetical protein [Actinosynnema sp. ALI-1.44]ONI73074.1 hypothetical protein ALI144C_44800 [Actinosynnema sp. ALI-1.44]
MFLSGQKLRASALDALEDDIADLLPLVDLLGAKAKFANVVANGTTTSATYTPTLTGAGGPSVQLTSVGTKALAIWSAQMFNNTATVGSWMSVAVSGVTTIAASDDYAAITTCGATGDAFRTTSFHLFTITPGVNTFTAQFRVGSSTGNFVKKSLLVIAP